MTRIVVEVTSTQPLQGVVIGPDGIPRPFCGWIDLNGVLAAQLAPSPRLSAGVRHPA